MDETIHINFGAYKSETQNIGYSKTRLWPAMLSSIRWLTQTGIPGHNLIPDGISLMIINNLAISVEGFIADIIAEHLDNGELEKPFEIVQLDWKKWDFKKELYNKLFTKKIESYPAYKSIEILFIFRNNISHGKTHTEVTKTDLISGEKSILVSVNEKYQKIREYLIEKNILKETDISSNIEVLWKLQTSALLFFEVTKFLFALIKENESDRKGGILAELNTAYQIKN